MNEVKRSIITTADGSKTIFLDDWNENYHSRHGAINEAYHVFIENGLFSMNRKQLSILEIGFGTGLNALITLHETLRHGLIIEYTGVEAFPVSDDEVEQLNYPEDMELPHLQKAYGEMHSLPWDERLELGQGFTLTKQKKDFREVRNLQEFDLIYFDAFGPRVQPELWTPIIFRQMFNALKEMGILVTYCAKGSVRRAMQEAGFDVERLPGPPGKREMLRARKILAGNH